MKIQKMKLTGYLCIGFSAILSILIMIPQLNINLETGMTLVKFWAAIMGLGLLFGNAGKRIGGQAVMNKAPVPGSEK